MSVASIPLNHSPWRGAVSRWTLMLALASIAACATHRSQPPECKGPFTPINQSSSAVSNGSQR
jgi:hypothetical protein